MKIKFRGRGLKDKKLYYGSYVQTMPQSSFPAILDNDGFYNEVDPASVAQFVGYDCNGDEVYEGDKLNHVDDEDYNAIAYIETYIGVASGTVECLADIHSSKMFSENNSKFWRLKGRGGNENL